MRIVTSLTLTTLVYGCFGNVLPNKYGASLPNSSELQGEMLSQMRDNNEIKQSKTTDGHLADWNDYPYVVAIMNGANMIGGGSIIADEFVVTNYWTNHGPSDIEVVHWITKKKVAQIYGFKRSIYGGLGALLRLESKFDFLQPNDFYAKLRNESVTKGTNCTVVSVYDVNGIGTEGKLYYNTVPIVDLEECNKYYNKTLSKDYLCAGVNEEDNNCTVRPGDPLICDGVLSGVADMNNKCKEIRDRGIYGDIAYFKAWIEKTINEIPTTTEVPETTTPGAAADILLEKSIIIVSYLFLFVLLFII